MKLYRSPPHDQDAENSHVTASTDPTLPAYSSSPSPSGSLGQMTEINQRKARNAGSYDEILPTSLRATGPTIDPNSMVLNDNENGQEMQDRGCGMDLLQGGKDGKDEGRYILGDYVPEISMGDREDEAIEETKHDEATGKEESRQAD